MSENGEIYTAGKIFFDGMDKFHLCFLLYSLWGL